MGNPLDLARATWRLGLCLVAALLVAPASVAQRVPEAAASRPPMSLEGDIRHVHDPTVIRHDGTYYLFSTRAGISVRCSSDLVRWRLCGDVFGHLPGWAVEDVPGLRGLWAPDISYFNGQYHLYYSASTFGKNRSSIGLATNVTLDPTNSAYRWVDRGKVIGSSPGDDWNAIDPNVVIDDAGRPWLSFGSFWGGIKMRRIDPDTGALDPRDTALYSLAARPRSASEPGAIEAPAIVRKRGYYFLFVSFDFCCRGVASTYNVRVGRSTRVTGPYVDRDGKDMRDGGGSPVISGAGRWLGPGHCSILLGEDGDWLVYHAYDAEAGGIPTLRIDSLVWDSMGWPSVRASGRAPR